nr:PREDICTED: transcription initiation factor TFIID subunit 12 [Apteryx mantelli mantelli]
MLRSGVWCQRAPFVRPEPAENGRFVRPAPNAPANCDEENGDIVRPEEGGIDLHERAQAGAHGCRPAPCQGCPGSRRAEDGDFYSRERASGPAAHGVASPRAASRRWLCSDGAPAGIITKGSSEKYDYYVTSYRVSSSRDGRNWRAYKGSGGQEDKVFEGNADSHEEVSNAFIPPIVARYVRVTPQRWHQRIALKVALVGCQLARARAPRPYIFQLIGLGPHNPKKKQDLEKLYDLKAKAQQIMNQFGPSTLINLSNFSSIKPEPASTPPQSSMANSTTVAKMPGTPSGGGRLSPESNQVLTKKKLQLIGLGPHNPKKKQDLEKLYDLKAKAQQIMNQFGPSTLINLSNFSSIKPEPASTPPQSSMANSTTVAKMPGTPSGGGRLSPESNQVISSPTLGQQGRWSDLTEG